MFSNAALIKEWLDKLLIVNFFVVIFGGVFFLISVASSMNGYNYLYQLFQSLWYPFFIPSISLFFSGILIEFIFGRINSKED